MANILQRNLNTNVRYLVPEEVVQTQNEMMLQQEAVCGSPPVHYFQCKPPAVPGALKKTRRDESWQHTNVRFAAWG